MLNLNCAEAEANSCYLSYLIHSKSDLMETKTKRVENLVFLECIFRGIDLSSCRNRICNLHSICSVLLKGAYHPLPLQVVITFKFIMAFWYIKLEGNQKQREHYV